MQDKTRTFKKAVDFYSFLVGGELKLAEKLIEQTDLKKLRINEILDPEDEETELTPKEMKQVADVLGISVDQMIWNQEQMDRLYGDFDLDYDIDVRDFNKRVLSNSIHPLGFARAVMTTIFSDGEPDLKEQLYFEHLKKMFNLTDEVILPSEEGSQEQYRDLINSLPEDRRFLTIVVKWIIGAVFADAEVTKEEVARLNELLKEIQLIRGQSQDGNLNLDYSS